MNAANDGLRHSAPYSGVEQVVCSSCGYLAWSGCRAYAVPTTSDPTRLRASGRITNLAIDRLDGT